MLDLVPLGGSRWHVHHGDRDAEFAGEPGQFHFPQPQPVPVGAAGVGGDQQAPRIGVSLPAQRVPPAADRRHGERGGVAVGADRHPAGVGTDVIHPVGHRLAQLLIDEVVGVHLLRLALRPPGAALAGIRPDQLLLLGIHADHRLTRRQGSSDLVIDIAELGVTVGVLGALQRLGVALQAVAQLGRQQPRHAVMRHPVPPGAQLTSQIAGRTGSPPQPGHRIPPHLRLYQAIQRLQQARVGLGQPLAAPAFPPDAPLQRVITRLQLSHPRRHRLARDPRGTRHHLDPAVPQPARLRAQHQPPAPLIQVRQQRIELDSQYLLIDLHDPGHTTRLPSQRKNRKVN